MTCYNIIGHSREDGWKRLGTVDAINDNIALGLATLQGLAPEGTPLKAEPSRISKRPKRKGQYRREYYSSNKRK